MGILQNCWAGNFVYANNEYVTVGSDASLNFLPGFHSFSFQAWINTASSDSNVHNILAKGFKFNHQYGISHNNTVITIQIGHEALEFDVLSLLGIYITNATWHHLVVTVSTTAVRLYVDGNLADVQPFTGTTVDPADVTIGGVRATNLTDITDTYDGLIDEVGIWATELGSAQVTALYNGGYGLMLDEDSGSYISSTYLKGWWRLGDGQTEHAGSVPTTTIYDVSGNGNTGTVNSDSLDLDVFYWGGNADTKPVPGQTYCDLYISSSSIVTAASGGSFTVRRDMQGNLASREGFEGSVHRMRLTCNSTYGVDNKIFVHEYGRPYPGISLQNTVFRRVVKLPELTTIPADTPQYGSFPFAFRTATADLYAPTEALLDAAWQEVQAQCATLALDLNEFGVPVGGALRGGASGAVFGGQEIFTVPTYEESSSAFVPPVVESSSSLIILPPPTFGSSSSDWVDPHALATTIYLAAEKDAATRYNQNGFKTLYNNLGFIRFGRNYDPTETWDAFLRFPVSLPKCAAIQSAYLMLFGNTSEAGTDVVVRVRDIYAAGYQPVSQFSGTADPVLARTGVVWDQLTSGYPSSPLSPQLNLTEQLQYFVDRWTYDPAGNEYFGLWLQEIVSDPGARRDAKITLSGNNVPYLLIQYRDDRPCSSSSAGG